MLLIIIGSFVALLVIVLMPKLQIKLADIEPNSNLDDTQRWENKLERIKLENELRKTILQLVGGVFLIAGIFFSWNQFSQTKERDLSEKLNKIVALMGSDKEYVQIGAIYSLEQVADNHENSSEIITNILSSFIRDYAIWKDTELPHRGKELTRAALRIISSSMSKVDKQTIDVSDTDLRSLNLEMLNLNGIIAISARFNSSDLKDASFENAILTGSSFDSANLENVSFAGADLRYASFKDTNIRGIDFSGADLSGSSGIDRKQIEEVAITSKETLFP